VKPVFRILYFFYRAVTWLFTWAWRRFTPAGLAVLTGTFITFFMSVDTEHNRNYQAFALLFCFSIVGFVLSLGFNGQFQAARTLPRFATVGVPLHYKVVLKNLTPKKQSGLTVLENVFEPRPRFQEWFSAQMDEQKRARSFRITQVRRTSPFRRVRTREVAADAPLQPQQEREIGLQFTPLRRGLLHLEGLTIARTDPLGLCRGTLKLALPQTVLVLPKRYALPPLAFPGHQKYQQGGVAQASHVGQSEEFAALRDYRRGDPLRHIHWRSWARLGKPIVREFEDEFFVRHALALDTFIHSEHSDLFEEAVSVAASFACTITTQESLLDLLFVGPQSYCFTSGRGLAHSDQMLEILASVQPCRHKPFQALEALVLDHSTALSGCICIFMSWDEARREFVRKLRLLQIPVLVLVMCEPGQTSLELGPMRDYPNALKCLELGKIQETLAGLGEERGSVLAGGLR
jgi:uncharacterized protein (DUF58 family)